MKYTFQEESPRSPKMETFLPNLCRKKYDIPTILQNIAKYYNIFYNILQKFERAEKEGKTRGKEARGSRSEGVVDNPHQQK